MLASKLDKWEIRRGGKGSRRHPSNASFSRELGEICGLTYRWDLYNGPAQKNEDGHEILSSGTRKDS